jgi:hypothetical protein
MALHRLYDRTLLRALACGALLVCVACTPASRSRAPGSPPPPLEELVEAQPNIAERDLFHGVGGKELVPPTDVAYRFLSKDTSGINDNFEVEDPSGRKWDAKFGSEVQAEVVASRLHWAIGFHQPPVYYVREWRIADGPHAGPQPEARFRYESPDWKKDGEWAWNDNPFNGTRELGGLVLLNVLINNWDLKTSNNKRYVRAKAVPHRIAIVKDLGQSFGASRWGLVGTNSDARLFARENLIREVDGDEVKFNFGAPLWNVNVARGITVDDVLWTCRRLAQLSERQWSDAFRAAGYGDDEAAAYIQQLRRKVQEGLELERRAES